MNLLQTVEMRSIVPKIQEFWRSPAFWPWLLLGLLLTAIDVFVMAAELAHRQWRQDGRFPWFSNSGWEADPDGSFAEMWMYTQAIIAAIALIVLGAHWARSSVLVALAALFITVAADDMLQIHERIGGQLSIRGMPDMFGLRGQDLGELATWSILGIILMTCVAVCYRASAPHARRLARLQLIPFVALVIFAIGVDITVVLSYGWGFSPRAIYLLELVETLGELLSLTAVVLVPMAFLLRSDVGAAQGREPALAHRAVLRTNSAPPGQ